MWLAVFCYLRVENVVSPGINSLLVATAGLCFLW